MVMRRSSGVLLLLALGLATARPASAEAPPILVRHVAAMKAGALPRVLADYAPDAVVVAPAGLANASGVFVGPGVRTLFAVLTDPAHVPGARSMQVRYEPAGEGVTLMRWVQFPGTPRQTSGHDVFVVRSGRIAFQSVTVDAPK